MVFDLYLLTHLWLLWIALLILFLAAEGISQNFITIWLALGALAGLLAERLSLSFTWQVVFFALSSLLCIIFLRPFCMRVLHSKTQPTNIAALIGQKAQALSDIQGSEIGQAKVGSQIWSAVMASDAERLTPGEKAVVREIRGVKLVLAKEPDAGEIAGNSEPSS